MTKTLKGILQDKVNAAVNRNATGVSTAFAKIQDEGEKLTDHVVPVDRLNFGLALDKDGILVMHPRHTGGRASYEMHEHAIKQIAERLGIPQAWLRDQATSADDWRRNNARILLDTHTGHNATRSDRFLMRSIGDEVRGVLSDKYKRMNSYKIYAAFLSEMAKAGGVPYGAHAGDTRTYMEMIRPNIIDIPTPKNGVVSLVMGARLRNSDYGDGALVLDIFKLLAICLNGQTSKRLLREVHLGGALPTDIRVSENTYKKDTERMASLIGDAVTTLFSEEVVQAEVDKIRLASGKEVDLQEEVKLLPKVHTLTEAEAKAVEAVLLAGREGDGMQGEATLWKLAQGVGAVARDTEDERRSRELEEVAGAIVDRAA